MAHGDGQSRRRSRKRALLAVAALAVCAIAVVAVALLPRYLVIRAAQDYPVTAATLAAAQRELAALAISSSGAATPYSRDAFGPSWADEDHNGCDTRNDILARDLAEVEVKTGTQGCVVLSGVLDDPYTGARIAFTRGADSAAVQIDHVVALSDAWRNGAWAWEAAQRQRFANDPVNLLAVDGETNQDKGSATADAWLPPNAGYRCAYAVRQIHVKHSYGLTVTSREHRALADAVDTCAVAG